MKKLYLIPTLLLFLNCKNEEKKIEKEGNGIVSTSLKTIKNSAGDVKDLIIESDSVKNEKKSTYYNIINKSYPEFKSVEKFFASNTPYILEKDGELYRVKELKITDDGTIIHNHGKNKDEALYFYMTKNNYYIYTFDISNKNNPEFKAVRRIKRGKFSQPIHDLIFENEKLIREDFVTDVSKDFFSKDGIQYFEIEKKTDDNKIINQYNLGQVRDF